VGGSGSHTQGDVRFPVGRESSPYSPECVELDFRWDEKADSPRSTLYCAGLQVVTSSNNGLNMEGESAHERW
jgi:hypothetical protein